MFHFLVPKKTHWHTRSNAIQRHDRIKIDCSLFVPGTWYVSPSLISLDERRQHRKNTYGCIKKWTSANKRCTTCTELWQLIKARAPNIAVINYAEGSIVCFCLLLLQIIERFKDVVGGGSCRLSVFFCLLYFLFAMVVFGFGSASSFILPSRYATLCSIPLVT